MIKYGESLQEARLADGSIAEQKNLEKELPENRKYAKRFEFVLFLLHFNIINYSNVVKRAFHVSPNQEENQLVKNDRN